MRWKKRDNRKYLQNFQLKFVTFLKASSNIENLRNKTRSFLIKNASLTFLCCLKRVENEAKPEDFKLEVLFKFCLSFKMEINVTLMRLPE